jgi:hypothetical protein
MVNKLGEMINVDLEKVIKIKKKDEEYRKKNKLK